MKSQLDQLHHLWTSSPAANNKPITPGTAQSVAQDNEHSVFHTSLEQTGDGRERNVGGATADGGGSCIIS